MWKEFNTCAEVRVQRQSDRDHGRRGKAVSRGRAKSTERKTVRGTPVYTSSFRSCELQFTDSVSLFPSLWTRGEEGGEDVGGKVRIWSERGLLAVPSLRRVCPVVSAAGNDSWSLFPRQGVGNGLLATPAEASLRPAGVRLAALLWAAGLTRTGQSLSEA